MDTTVYENKLNANYLAATMFELFIWKLTLQSTVEQHVRLQDKYPEISFV